MESPNITIKTLPPEKRYVRRSAKDFKAGAEPVIGRGSHRLVEQKLTLTPELLAAAKEAAKDSEIPFAVWARAAFRKALRDSMDPAYELETEVEIAPPSDGPNESEPK